jgi:hypothetical protein
MAQAQLERRWKYAWIRSGGASGQRALHLDTAKDFDIAEQVERIQPCGISGEVLKLGVLRGKCSMECREECQYHVIGTMGRHIDCEMGDLKAGPATCHPTTAAIRVMRKKAGEIFISDERVRFVDPTG